MEDQPMSLERCISVGVMVALIIAVWGVFALTSAYFADTISNRFPLSTVFEWLVWLFAATGPINAFGYVLWYGINYHHELKSESPTDQLGESAA